MYKGGDVMELDAIISSITQVGFPIICCVAMGYFFKYVFDKMVEQGNRNAAALERQTETHSAETKELTNVINSNTQALIALKEKLDKE